MGRDAIHLVPGIPGLLTHLGDGVEDFGGGKIFGAYWAGAGDVNRIADADGAGEADDGFLGGCAGDVGAGHR
jgi:hypothetical protein